MYPTIGDLLGIRLPVSTHALFLAVALAVAALVFRAQARRLGQSDEAILYVVLGALLGGGVFMRLGTWLQHLDLRRNASLAEQWAYGNKSIIGGLFGAWLGVHIAKRVVGYRARTGDLFAPAVAAGMAVGRIGCLLTERPGTQTGNSFGITLDAVTAARLGAPAGVPLHPSMLYEIAFHILAFCVLWFWLRHKPIPAGESFTLYIAAYGIFRFLVEFVRGNEVVWYDLTRVQLVLLATLPVLLTRIALLARRGELRALTQPGGIPAPEPVEAR